jgi:hypothetical protein
MAVWESAAQAAQAILAEYVDFVKIICTNLDVFFTPFSA